MTETEAINLARKMMDKEGLREWDIKINGRLSRALGRTFFKSKRIELNKDFITRNFKWQIEGVIKHEMAHALVGPEHSHNRVFREKCIALKTPPEFHGPTSVAKIKKAPPKPMRFSAKCPTCSHTYQLRNVKAGTNYYCRNHVGHSEINRLTFGYIS